MSKKINPSLGEIILQALKDKGLKQSKVADKMNVKRQTINQIDRRKTFDLEFLQKLKDATDLDFTSYIYQNGGNRQNSEDLVSEILTNSNSNAGQQIEMSLAIRLKSDPIHISKMGELLVLINKEAARLGFTIL